jgi:REP element-mobilizing transposase RayT
MSVSYNPEKHHRRSIRLKGYDYSKPGAYFVTICLQGRASYLEIPEVRHIVEDAWKALPKRFLTIELDEFVVMPDHFHFILHLHPDHKNRPTLSNIVGAYKSLTARAALSYLRTLGDICENQFWQPHFYDHIICNKTELLTIRKYIRNNPLKSNVQYGAGVVGMLDIGACAIHEL